MLSTPVDSRSLKQLAKLIETTQNMVITCHVKPDGDAVGSTLALWHVLQQLGKTAYVLAPDAPPRTLRFLPGAKDMAFFSADEDFGRRLLNEAELIFCLDYNAAYRTDRMAQALVEAKAPKVMIDHHLDPEKFADITVSVSADSSTCVLLYKVLCQLGLRMLVNKDAATCLCAGMMTDTGNFSYNANNPEIYLIMAELLRCGVDKVAIWQRLNVKEEWPMRLNGYAIARKMTLFHDRRVSLMQLSRAELDEYHYQKGDMEGLVNVPLDIPGVQMSVLMHQEPDFTKVSMRSRGSIPVNKICEKYFGGGGHLNAAGGEFHGTLDEARQLLEKVVPEFNEFFTTTTD